MVMLFKLTLIWAELGKLELYWCEMIYRVLGWEIDCVLPTEVSQTESYVSVSVYLWLELALYLIYMI